MAESTWLFMRAVREALSANLDVDRKLLLRIGGTSACSLEIL